ncbi:YggS family pyridoxal phosphate-dependent enzyme [Candidatus Sumerlaeota bacterium]|nr:YggS family pyridoxal phosphate-dependent enzyme [Candidatus Sumerlaeota bacterium]
MTSIAQNLADVEGRITAACERAARKRDEVLLVAVTKTRPISDVNALRSLGIRDMAENRVQDVRDRIAGFPPDVACHFIGHLQTNKAKFLPGVVAIVHTVDRLQVAAALNKAWEASPTLVPLRVLLQFNIAEEAQKSGAAARDAHELLMRVAEFPRLHVEGLMTMAPLTDDPETSRPVFRALRALRDDLQQRSGINLPVLSMGMSGDFEVAVEEGATMLRVGSALFV